MTSELLWSKDCQRLNLRQKNTILKKSMEKKEVEESRIFE